MLLTYMLIKFKPTIWSRFNNISLLSYNSRTNNFQTITCPNLVSIFISRISFFPSLGAVTDLSSKNHKKKICRTRSKLRACINFFFLSTLFLVRSWIFSRYHNRIHAAGSVKSLVNLETVDHAQL